MLIQQIFQIQLENMKILEILIKERMILVQTILKTILQMNQSYLITVKTEEDYYYYDYSDRVLYLFSVSKNCCVIISPIFLILGTVGNFLSITVLRRWVFMFSLLQYRCNFLAHHNAYGVSWNFSHHVCIDLLGCTNYLPRECRSTDNIGCLKILLILAGLQVLEVF